MGYMELELHLSTIQNITHTMWLFALHIKCMVEKPLPYLYPCPRSLVGTGHFGVWAQRSSFSGPYVCSRDMCWLCGSAHTRVWNSKIRSSHGKLEKRPSRGCWTANVLYLLFWEDTCDRSRVRNKVGGAGSSLRFRGKMAVGMDFLVDPVNS
jgi:hypothetical protein